MGHIQPLGGVGLFDKKGIWKKDTSSDDLKTLAARVSAKIEEGDVRGAVRIASSNDKLAPFDDNSAEALRLLHPPRTRSLAQSAAPSNIQFNNSSASTLSLTVIDIITAIKSFPAGSPGGLDGVRPQHLKDITSPYIGETRQLLVLSLKDLPTCV